MAPKAKPVRFMATIYKIWLMRHVNVPDDIARELLKRLHAGSAATKRAGASKRKYIPVIATVGGKSTRTTIVPARGGKYRMQINTAQRKAARVDWGDAVSVELRIDLASRAVPFLPISARRLPSIRRPARDSRRCRPGIGGNSLCGLRPRNDRKLAGSIWIAQSII